MGYFTALEQLVLRGNKLTGTIPPTFANLRSLERLDLSRNALTGPIPEELSWGPPTTTLPARYLGGWYIWTSGSTLWPAPSPGLWAISPALSTWAFATIP